MRHINGIYTQKYNRSLKTDGPLFRGRYKAQLIGDDCCQLIVSRYIHLNPLEARLVNNPADYEWSSYSAYLGMVKTPYWLSTDIIINQLAEIKALSHVKNYQDYVEGKNIDEINVFSSIKYTVPIIGSETFKEKMLSKIDAKTATSCSTDLKHVKTIPGVEMIINHACSFYNINRESLIYSKRGMLNWPKLVCMYICRKKYGHTLGAISQCVGLIRPETVSSEIRKCHFRLMKSPNLFDEINDICELIKKSIVNPSISNN